MKPCPVCARDTSDGLLCGKCTDGHPPEDKPGVRYQIGRLPELMHELTVTLTRQTSIGAAIIRRPVKPATDDEDPYTKPLPYDPTTRPVRDQVINTMTTWLRDLDHGDLESIPVCACRPYMACNGRRPVPDEHAAWLYYRVPRTMTEWATWLLDRVDRIRRHDAVAEFVRDLNKCVAAIEKAIDRPPDRLYIGPCGVCECELFVYSEDETITCPRCTEILRPYPDAYLPRYQAHQSREEMRRDLRGQLATRADIITGVAAFFEVPIPAGTFDSWVSRGRIAAKGTREGVATYPIATVLELVETRRTQRRAG